MLDEGRRVFRFETFGDEAFWGDTLKLHQAIAGADAAGIVLGARVPIILTSRADSVLTRLASCAVAVLVAKARREAGTKAVV